MKVFVVSAILAATLFGAWAFNGWTMGSRVPVVGTPAENFHLVDLNGNSQSLLDYRGKVVLLNLGHLVQTLYDRNAGDADDL